MHSLTDQSEFLQRFMMARCGSLELWGLSCPVYAFSGITLSKTEPAMYGVDMSAWIMNQVSLFIEWVAGLDFTVHDALKPSSWCLCPVTHR